MHDVAVGADVAAPPLRRFGPNLAWDRRNTLYAAAFLAALALAVPTAFLWGFDGGAALVLLLFAVLSDIKAVEGPYATKLSGSFIAIIVACVVAGPLAGVLVGAVSVLAGWAVQRYRLSWLLLNLATYTWFPLIAGAFFYESLSLTDDGDVVGLHLLVAAAFVIGTAVDFLIIAIYNKRNEGVSLVVQWRTIIAPIMPVEVLSLGLTLIGAHLETTVGTLGLLPWGLLVLAFQSTYGIVCTFVSKKADLRLRSRQLARVQLVMLRALLETVHLRDPGAADHSAHTAAYARRLAARLGLGEREQRIVHAAGVLHDIGKYSFPDELFEDVPDRLRSAQDQERIRRHPLDGAAIIARIEGGREIAEVIACHRELPDGSGHPRGLRDSEIPLAAQIVGICAAYDAMMRPGWGRPGVDPATALRLVEKSGFDGRVTQEFIAMIADGDQAFRSACFTSFEEELKEAEALLESSRPFWRQPPVPSGHQHES